jgi:phosphoglucomutase
MKTETLNKANEWLSPFFDEDTRSRIQYLIANDEQEIIESFYKDLEFGTGGMRGIMGPGTNRINKYTIGKATAGLGDYLKEQFTGQISVAIAYDSRNLSGYFANVAAQVLSAKGIKVYVFNELRPTPELSFAVRYLKCQAGIVITASHNPKEYNGFKVYWNDGGQLVPPHDKGVIDKVNAIGRFEDIDFNGNDNLIEFIDEKVDKPYAEKVLGLVDQNTKRDTDIGVVFTSLHGTGITHIPEILKKSGFKNIYVVEEQAEPDGNFPTVESPNPEEQSALQMAIELAKVKDADLVMGTDPDADRIGLAVKDHDGNWVVLNGNQSGSILVKYLLDKTPESEYPTSFICKTIVTTGLIDEMAEKYKVKCINTLTGFKYIAREIRQLEGKMKFIGGGEESFGYLAGDFVRDKDAIISAVLFVQIASIARAQGLNLLDYLYAIYEEFGVYRERLVSLTKKGKEGVEEIMAMMESFRTDTPTELNGEKVTKFIDYQSGVIRDLVNNTELSTGIDRSNVLQFETEKGSLITVRPSGTEPKIKFYFSVNSKVQNNDTQLTIEMLEHRLDGLENAFM